MSDPFDDSKHALPADPTAVTIFGAGIAGLTAAHELVERGFRVQVWETQGDERRPERGCDVGGMARTQWAAVDWKETLSSKDRQTPPRMKQARGIHHVGERFYLRWHPGKLALATKAADYEPVLADLFDSPAIGELELDVFVHAFGLTRLPADERNYRTLSWARQALVDLAGRRSVEPRFSEADGRLDVELPGGVFRVHTHVQESESADHAQIRLQLSRPDGTRSMLLFEQEWEPGELISLSGKPAQTEDWSKLLDALRDHPEIGILYAEISAQHIDHLSREEFKRRINYAKNRFLKFIRPDYKFAASDVSDDGTLHSLDIELDAKRAEAGEAKRPKRNIRVLVVRIEEQPYSAAEHGTEHVETVISFRPRLRWLPGEHGYRFFPSFYHHVFDTMKRTPLLDVIPKSKLAQAQERAVGIEHPEAVDYVETGSTAFDNLQPTSSHVLAFTAGQRPSQLARASVRSFEELRSYLKVIFGDNRQGFGLDPRDATRLALKILQFATASDQRRREWEEMSWWDFLEAGTLSENAKTMLKKWPRALVAMDAVECDARTHWIPLFQILLDQVRPAGYRDGTLRGPTNEAWLNPWRRYLEAQGVEFIRGKLDGFEFAKDQQGVTRLWPKVICEDSRYAAPGSQPPLRPGYFVVAVSPQEALRLSEASLGGLNEHRHSDLERARRLGDIGGEQSTQYPSQPLRTGTEKLAEDLKQATPKGDFRHFCGIQYYFAEDVYWSDGHVYYADSRWALTSISQARFWQDKMDWEHGYRGVLSVIIGEFNEPGHTTTNLPAWKCNANQLATEVWHQIKSSLKQRDTNDVGRFARRTPMQRELPEPLFWHLDTNFKVPEVSGHGTHPTNDSPFFIARAKRFETRPGSLDEQGYAVEFGLVLAGYYTKTYTRLPSMEAANESARHAVNAILRHREQRMTHPIQSSYCDVWNPEDREVEDLQFLKDLDARLCERGVPHLFDVMDLDHVATHLLRGGDDDPLDPVMLLSRLRKLYQQDGAP